jgi:hypothetical protein
VEKMHAHPRTAVQYCHKHRFPALPFEAFAYFIIYFRYWAELNNLLLPGSQNHATLCHKKYK